MKSVAWVIGRGGLLGSHLEKETLRRGWQPFVPNGFSWRDEAALRREFAEAARGFSERVMQHKGTQWIILWAAGAGVMGTDEGTMRRETESFRAFLDAIHVCGLAESTGTIFFASTAGAMYAHPSDKAIDEETPPSPSSPYGKEKLAQESLLREWADRHANIRVLIGRISNLYGPGQNVRKQQGLISHFSRSVLTNIPLHVYVPLDTIRDYCFAPDCARHVLSCLERMSHHADEERVTLKIFASERTTTIAEIIGIFRRLTKRSPRVICSKNKLTKAYVRIVRFRSRVWPDAKPERITLLPVGIAAVHADMLRARQSGSERS